MEKSLFLMLLTALLAILFAWAFPRLHRKEWQFLAAVPLEEEAQGGSWKGINLTFYGFFVASANALALMLFILLASAIGLGLKTIFLLAGATFLVCLPGARIVARLVEGKKNTFTVSGASFVGLIAFPLVVLFVNRTQEGHVLPLVPLLAALATSYALGEGLGRLACLSFGCCYGKPLSTFSPFVETLLRPFSITFAGQTKKISYEGKYFEEAVVPVQMLTAVVHSLVAVTATALYLEGLYNWSVLLAVVATQSWRVASEFLRSDHRGGGRFTAYQAMSLFSILGTGMILNLAPAVAAVVPNLATGMTALWTPEAILAVQALWVLVFFYMGRSTVTASRISFSVRVDRI